MIGATVAVTKSQVETAKGEGQGQRAGVCDRLRAVILTTATTVFGLVPFLLPTVITLSYGFGFVLVLVILLVPALLLVQRDVDQSVAGGS